MNSSKLKGKMVEKEVDIYAIAKQLDLSYNSTRKKINGQAKLYVDEVNAIRMLLNLSDSETIDIFLN